ncbi:LysR family transcriptional regulator [uncultured Pseudomonas sp.]|uniref:LysR family transcriptional regulator n=1 Tax=uncultured Pseudomonas sp. TaxID=114707 RepID=UPI002609FE05|nr:LysR family transcriptional regulator [uncultured Pseudomonas sp.]
MPTSDALHAFVQAVSCGSFSAAARRLGKSQSTISAAIANLEADLGLQLFDRSSRKPTLTEHGQVMLGKAEAVLTANQQLARAAMELGQGLESKLTIVLSDTYQSERFEQALDDFQQRYPQLQLECLIAEYDDLLALLQQGRAQLGFIEAQPTYPSEISACALAEDSDMALYVTHSHPLAQLAHIDPQQLHKHRELRLGTVLNSTSASTPGYFWSAPSYLMLMEMAELGFGWAPLPRRLVARFGSAALRELTVPGWPRQIIIDAVTSRVHNLGPAGGWLLKRMTD